MTLDCQKNIKTYGVESITYLGRKLWYSKSLLIRTYQYKNLDAVFLVMHLAVKNIFQFDDS